MRDGAAIVATLGGRRGSKGWSFCCPCHPDRVASCSIRDDGLLTCFAGCPRASIAARLDELGFPDDGQSRTTPIADDVPARVSAARKMWKNALGRQIDTEAVASYLRSRRITLPVPTVMRRWKNGFIAAVQRRDLEIIAVHAKTPGRKGITYGWTADGAVRLAEPEGEELGL